MKKIEKPMIIAYLLLCGALVLSCSNATSGTTQQGVESTGWSWEALRDDFPVQFAAGISTLNGITESTTEYFQTYVLADPYEWGNPLTGKIALTTDPGTGITIPVMQDAVGFDPNLYWPDNKEKGAKIPKRTPILETVAGPNGDNVQAIHIWGTVLQRGSESDDPNSWVPRTGSYDIPFGPGSPATDYRFCASWPTISLYATPTPEALKTFREDGYGYTFWVKVNKTYGVYSTSIENWDYRAREDYEPKHYFGIVPGRDPLVGINYTQTPVGQWKQIKVIYDPENPDYNMDIPQWINMYGIQGMYPGDTEPGNIKFNLQHMMRIIFDISLPNNGGIEGSQYQQNTISTGKHDYDVYFYGLQFLQY